MENLNPFRGDPEQKLARHEELSSTFEDRVARILNNHTQIERLLGHQDLRAELEKAKKETGIYPVNEDQADVIGERIGVGTEDVVALSKYLNEASLH
jgi:hypothetical protein